MTQPAEITVTDQTIDISHVSTEKWLYYENLYESIIQKYLDLNKNRAIFVLAGPSGAGKSVTSAILKHLSADNKNSFEFVNVSLDAYHYENKKLEELGLRDVKGRYDTYDINQLSSDLVAFKGGDSLWFPAYSRKNHEPVKFGQLCDSNNAILWLEGGWLLYPEYNWDTLMGLYDHTYFIQAPQPELQENVIGRHIKGGKDFQEAAQFFNDSDSHNIQLISKHSLEADEQILFWKKV